MKLPKLSTMYLIVTVINALSTILAVIDRDPENRHDTYRIAARGLNTCMWAVLAVAYFYHEKEEQEHEKDYDGNDACSTETAISK
ncbi:hypothetical protein BHAP_1235 [Bifidobacterium hapali]|uniref:Carbon starvation protein n=1 Tax=Bifidobacterium hapali TaxID=1630172 RepID=A0A261FYR0_9BIFI|nr:hypothetical protein [Bifidobacterium hapali]OZG64334.1 hypothetical protein BHAP_1235 [Bifidobacterium hapali]